MLVRYYNYPQEYFDQGFGEFMQENQWIDPNAGKPRSVFHWIHDWWCDFLDYRPGEFSGNAWAVGGY